MWSLIVAGVALAAWVGLSLGHGGFWRTSIRLPVRQDPQSWPSVVAVVPARDEAAMLPSALPSLLATQYPGDFRVIIVDDAKLSPVLGLRAPLPVEVLPFGWRTQQLFLETLGARVQLRRTPSGAPYRTEQDNHILDCELGPILQPHALARMLGERAGIVAHGLFLDLATDLVIAGEGGIHHETRGART